MKDEESTSTVLGLGDPISEPISEEQENRLRSRIDRVKKTAHTVVETEDGWARVAVFRLRTREWLRDYEDGDQS